MRRWTITVFCASLIILAAHSAIAADGRSGAAARGKGVATKACAGCHDVADDLKAAPERHAGTPPPFLTVAASRDLDAAQLGEFLRTPHGEMDHLAITGRETDDVVAYIMNLRRR